MEIEINTLFDEPKIIALVGNSNSGKSNTLHHLILEAKKNNADNTANMCSYGLKFDFGENKISSIPELEQTENSIIFLDEFYNLFDLEDRKEKKSIEKTLTRLFHSNNIIILCGFPENFKKFISAKIDIIIFKECSLNGFINGSKLKQICRDYKGDEIGSYLLKLKNNEALLCSVSNSHWEKVNIPYYKEYDIKRQKNSILIPKSVPKSVPESVPKSVPRKMFQKTFQNVLKNVPKCPKKCSKTSTNKSQSDTLKLDCTAQTADCTALQTALQKEDYYVSLILEGCDKKKFMAKTGLSERSFYVYKKRSDGMNNEIKRNK